MKTLAREATKLAGTFNLADYVPSLGPHDLHVRFDIYTIDAIFLSIFYFLFSIFFFLEANYIMEIFD